MNTEKANAHESAGATVLRGSILGELCKAEGRYKVRCIDQRGNLKWEDTIENTVMTEGKNLMLDCALGVNVAVVGPFMGLISSVSYTAIATALFVVAVVEVADAQDISSEVDAESATLTEAASASDNISATALFVAGMVETANAQDASSDADIEVADITGSANATDTLDATIVAATVLQPPQYIFGSHGGVMGPVGDISQSKLQKRRHREESELIAMLFPFI